MIMFHAVVKFIPNFAGGTGVKQHLGMYIAFRKKKFKVLRYLLQLLYLTTHIDLPLHIAFNLHLQRIIKDYYDPVYHYSKYIADLEKEKIAGDELILVLLAKYLKRNITVVSPFNTWTIFLFLKTDIVLMFDGCFGATQHLSTSAAAQSGV